MRIVLGDITEVEADAIVNPANELLIMGGGVAYAIKKRGGDEIEREALSQGPIRIGEAVATSAGKLKARYVIHSPTVKEPGGNTNSDWVKLATNAALNKARELKISSLAFPLMGAGVGGLSIEESIRAMMSVLEGVKDIEIMIVIRDESTYRRLRDILGRF
jgi:O-acetyl-ADP-ribose deacetylase (regulator of RNase III)